MRKTTTIILIFLAVMFILISGCGEFAGNALMRVISKSSCIAYGRSTCEGNVLKTTTQDTACNKNTIYEDCPNGCRETGGRGVCLTSEQQANLGRGFQYQSGGEGKSPGGDGKAPAGDGPPACVPSEFQCSDCADNDGDGFIDYGEAETSDPDCTTPLDDTELGGEYGRSRTTQCSDGEDNDLDHMIDLDDPGCEDADDNDEADDPELPVASCFDDDGGPAYSVQGTVTVVSAEGVSTDYDDTCVDEEGSPVDFGTNLREYFCRLTEYSSRIQTCADACVEGRCVSYSTCGAQFTCVPYEYFEDVESNALACPPGHLVMYQCPPEDNPCGALLAGSMDAYIPLPITGMIIMPPEYDRVPGCCMTCVPI